MMQGYKLCTPVKLGVLVHQTVWTSKISCLQL